MAFLKPRKTTDNPFIESFNGNFRNECLNTHWFLSLFDARKKIETLRKEYNEFHPHSSLEKMIPNDFTCTRFDHSTSAISLQSTPTD
nr:integrase core domain-containing protein [Halodesulfovibrio marinisediminis]